jgi:hypothetical protein
MSVREIQDQKAIAREMFVQQQAAHDNAERKSLTSFVFEGGWEDTPLLARGESRAGSPLSFKIAALPRALPRLRKPRRRKVTN